MNDRPTLLHIYLLTSSLLSNFSILSNNFCFRAEPVSGDIPVYFVEDLNGDSNMDL